MGKLRRNGNSNRAMTCERYQRTGSFHAAWMCGYIILEVVDETYVNC